jgi:hypothetical protein
MDSVAFAGPNELLLISSYLASRPLSRCVLRNIIVNGKTVLFDGIHASMPKTRLEYSEAHNGRFDLVEVPRIKSPSYELHLYNSHEADDEVDTYLHYLLELVLDGEM